MKRTISVSEDEMGDPKQRLFDAFVELLHEQPIKSISVKQISERSGLSTRTFYNHFNDKYDLLSWLTRDTLKAMFERLGNDYDYRELIKDCYVGVDLYGDTLRVFWDSELFDQFFGDVTGDTISLFRNYLAKNGVDAENEQMRFLIESHLRANNAMLRAYALGCFTVGPEQLADWTIEYMPQELKDLLHATNAL